MKANSKVAAETEASSLEFNILTEEMKTRLRQSSRVRALLRSKKLQNKILAVDGADDRFRELKKARLDPEFDMIIEVMLEELGS